MAGLVVAESAVVQSLFGLTTKLVKPAGIGSLMVMGSPASTGPAELLLLTTIA